MNRSELINDIEKLEKKAKLTRIPTNDFNIPRLMNYKAWLNDLSESIVFQEIEEFKSNYIPYTNNVNKGK